MYANNFISNQVSENNYKCQKLLKSLMQRHLTTQSSLKIFQQSLLTQFFILMILIVNKLIESVGRRDKIKMIINHPVLSERIEFPFMFAKDLNSDLIMSEISKCDSR